MFNFRATILHIAAIAIHTAPAFAQATPTGTIEQDIAKRIKKTNEKDFISLSVENDMLGGGTDRYYTSGVRLTWFNVSTPVPPVIDKLADNIPTFDLNETTSTFFTIGQNLYTPENIKIASNQNNDRPWAGFLYGSVGVATLEDNHIDELEVTLGVVGPEALGEQTQKFVHKEISNSPTPRGWKNQIDFEPGLILSAARRWPRFYHEEHAGFRLTAEPNINASIGNIYTYAGAGMSLSLSPDDGALRDKPPRVRPAMPGSGYFETPENGMGWVLFAGLDARAVARDIFLDGNTFKSSHNVDKNHFIADATAGIAFTFDRYRLAYSINTRSKEFKTQDDPAVFGSLTLSTRF